MHSWAGKSTVARQVAQALGLLYLDTGAEALTWLVLQSGICAEDMRDRRISKC